jgi:glycosyltransferase involved in cell wall biosynthesis
MLFIAESNIFGGTDTFILDFASEFIKNKIEVNILINKSHQGIYSYKRNYINLEFFTIPPLYELSSNFKIFYKLLILILYPFLAIFNVLDVLLKIKKISPDIIIVVNGGFPGGFLTYTSMLSCGFSGVNTIYSIHNYCNYSKKYLLYNLFIETIASLFGNIIFTSVSKDCAKNIKKNAFLKKDIYFVYNGVKDLNQKKDLPDFNYSNDFNIVWAGRIVESKNIDIIISAFKKIKINKFYNNVNLFLYGFIEDKNYYNKIKLIANKEKNIKFILNEKDKNKIYKDKHLVILPSSKFESFGLILIEGMSFGLPVISSNLASLEEVVNINENLSFGFVFDISDINDLIKKIELIIKNKEVYMEFSKNARIAYEKYFTVEKMYLAYLKLIGDLGWKI